MARRKCDSAHSPSMDHVNGTQKPSRAEAWTAQHTAIATMLSKVDGDPGLAFFLELFFFGGTEARGRPKRFAIVVEREIAHVEERAASWRLLVDHDGDGASFDAVAKR